MCQKVSLHFVRSFQFYQRRAKALKRLKPWKERVNVRRMTDLTLRISLMFKDAFSPDVTQILVHPENTQRRNNVSEMSKTLCDIVFARHGTLRLVLCHVRTTKDPGIEPGIEIYFANVNTKTRLFKYIENFPT